MKTNAACEFATKAAYEVAKAEDHEYKKIQIVFLDLLVGPICNTLVPELVADEKPLLRYLLSGVFPGQNPIVVEEVEFIGAEGAAALRADALSGGQRVARKERPTGRGALPMVNRRVSGDKLRGWRGVARAVGEHLHARKINTTRSRSDGSRISANAVENDGEIKTEREEVHGERLPVSLWHRQTHIACLDAQSNLSVRPLVVSADDTYAPKNAEERWVTLPQLLSRLAENLREQKSKLHAWPRVASEVSDAGVDGAVAGATAGSRKAEVKVVEAQLQRVEKLVLCPENAPAAGAARRKMWSPDSDRSCRCCNGTRWRPNPRLPV
eukprot:g17923.t1